jgi:endonuclease/exonuclease/phosphatase (EEP) superfamily protein YafD
MVFDDGYTNQSSISDAVYFAKASTACVPDGTSQGNCHKWFGRCTTIGVNPKAVKFRVFNDGYSNQTALVDAIYINSPNLSCIPDGTPKGDCRRWFGLAETDDGRKSQCYLFNDGNTEKIGPTQAIYYAGPGKVCMPDGSASGACRKWFGQCEVMGAQEPIRLRVMVWNIEEGSRGIDKIAAQINNQNPDLVLLNEVLNQGWPWGNNQTLELAKKTNMPYYHWVNTVALGITGYKAVAVLSKLPLEQAFEHKVMYNGKETAFAVLETSILLGDVKHRILSTRFAPHNSDQHALENIAALQQFTELMKNRDKTVPIIFGGDFNAREDAPAMQNFIANSELISTATRRPDLEACDPTPPDYLFYRGPYEVTTYQRRCPGPDFPSDHPWIVVDFLEIGPPYPEPQYQEPIGYLDAINNMGVVNGWSLDPDLPDQSIDIHFYLDGGTFIGTINANKSRPDVNRVTGYPGNHGFNFQIPIQYIDGRNHTLYAYGIDITNNNNRLLTGSPLSFTISSGHKISVAVVSNSKTKTKETVTIKAVDAVTGAPLNGTILVKGQGLIGSTGSPLTYTHTILERDCDEARKPPCRYEYSEITTTFTINVPGYDSYEFTR